MVIFLIFVNIFFLNIYAAQDRATYQTAEYYTEIAREKMEEALLLYDGANFPNKPLWAEAIEYGEKAIAEDPDFIEGHYYLAQIYQYTNWFFKEAREWGKYIELISKDRLVSPEVENKLAYAYYRLGYSAYQREEYDVCIDYLENALNFNPLMIEVHYWLGRVFYETGNLEESYSSWKKVLEIDKYYPKVNYFLDKVEKAIKYGKDAYEFYEAGFNLYQQKLYESAIYEYRQAINSNNNFTEAYYWLGRIYFELGNHQEAINYWKEVLKLEPENQEATYWLNQSEKQLKK